MCLSVPMCDFLHMSHVCLSECRQCVCVCVYVCLSVSMSVFGERSSRGHGTDLLRQKRGCWVGWSDFEILLYTFHVVSKCCWTPIPKFHVLINVALNCRRASENLTLTLKSANVFA